MVDSFYLAWRYLLFNKIKTTILISCITLIAILPLSLEILLKESEHQLVLRAESSPLLVGAKGSALDLVMNTLYFSDEYPETITMKAVEDIIATDLAAPVPVHIRFKARQYPIVGTTLDYFSYRNLQLASGEMFSLLGQCVIGSEVAERLMLKPGDSLVSSPETLFDLAGVYPLKMRVQGVLSPSQSADDHAVFVDIQTSWIIKGLGHGHKDVTTTTDSSVILKRSDSQVTANAKLMQYTEITEENIDSFHMHGNPETFPLTSVLVFPHDQKSATLLQGRYLEKDTQLQIVKPLQVIQSLLANIFKLRNILDGVIALVGIATLLALFLVFSLSMKLREREMEVIFKIGCSRTTIAKLLIAEILILLLISATLCLIFSLLLSNSAETLVKWMIL